MGWDMGRQGQRLGLKWSVYRDMTSSPGCRRTGGPQWQGEQCERDPPTTVPEATVRTYLCNHKIREIFPLIS